MKIASSQFNYKYGDQIHFPYSIGCLISYLQSVDEIANSITKINEACVFRDKFSSYIDANEDADILLCSCYVWNWEITTQFAECLKSHNPNTLVIFGGPQVPDRMEGFFDKYPFVDLAIHNEGEVVLESVIKEYLTTQKYDNLKGVSTKDSPNWIPQERIEDLNRLPSPYLSGTMDLLIDKKADVQWIGSLETNRGCPYSCTFCDWGSATYSKVRKFSRDKVLGEIEWFAKKQLPYVDNCDANFGMFKEDLDIAKQFAEMKKKYGKPDTYRQSWAKVSSDRLIPIAKELHNAGLLSAVGLALQSLDSTTLKDIERANIKFSTFSDLTKKFEDEGLPTYTEIIRALPSETLESFTNGLETLVSDSRIGAIYIYACGLLPNAPMNHPHYREKFKITGVRSPIYLAHTSKDDRDIQEYEEIITSTHSATREDVEKMHLYSWCILCLHNFNILNYIAKYFNQEYGLRYMDFYKSFILFVEGNETCVFGNELKLVKQYIKDGYDGKGWNHFESDFGPINWPIEEASWLRLTNNRWELWRDIRDFVKFLKDTDDKLPDLVCFQIDTIPERSRAYEHYYAVYYDWKKYFEEGVVPERQITKYRVPNLKLREHADDRFEWAKHAIWYGRRKGNYKVELGEIEYVY